MKHIYFDGGTRHNNVCVVDGDIQLVNKMKFPATNNQLEYYALLKAIVYVIKEYDEKDYKDIIFVSDSKLVVEQIHGKDNGGYEVKSKNLIELYEQVINIMELVGLKRTQIMWVPREANVAGHLLEK